MKGNPRPSTDCVVKPDCQDGVCGFVCSVRAVSAPARRSRFAAICSFTGAAALFANDYFAPSVCVSAQLSHGSATGLRISMRASPSPLPPTCHFVFAFDRNGQIFEAAFKRKEKNSLLLTLGKEVFGV